MEENRIMENLENEEILTDLEVYNNDLDIVTEPDETEEIKEIVKPKKTASTTKKTTTKKSTTKKASTSKTK